MSSSKIVEVFLEAVQIDSPSGHEAEMAAWVTNRLRSIGLSPDQDNFGNVIVKIAGPGEPLMFTAHLDTVEPGRNIKPRVAGGVITGNRQTILGADNKAAVAAILTSVERLIGERVSHRNLEIVFTLSEEVGNYGAVNLDYSRILAKAGFSFDYAAPLGRVVIASPFYDRFDLEITGRSAHASQPQEAINALSIFNYGLNEIRMGQIDAETVANIGVVSGGSVRNTVMGQVAAKGEVRSFSEEKLEQYSDKIYQTFSRICAAGGAELGWDLVRENSGFNFSKDEPLAKRAKEVLERLGLEFTLEKSWGCYDANIFVEKGIRVLNMGDGSSGAHTTREQIKVTDLVKLGDLVFELMKGGGKSG